MQIQNRSIFLRFRALESGEGVSGGTSALVNSRSTPERSPVWPPGLPLVPLAIMCHSTEVKTPEGLRAQDAADTLPATVATTTTATSASEVATSSAATPGPPNVTKEDEATVETTTPSKGQGRGQGHHGRGAEGGNRGRGQKRLLAKPPSRHATGLGCGKCRHKVNGCSACRLRLARWQAQDWEGGRLFGQNHGLREGWLCLSDWLGEWVVRAWGRLK